MNYVKITYEDLRKLLELLAPYVLPDDRGPVETQGDGGELCVYLKEALPEPTAQKVMQIPGCKLDIGRHFVDITLS